MPFPKVPHILQTAPSISPATGNIDMNGYSITNCLAFTATSAGKFNWASRAALTSPADGVLQINNNAGTSGTGIIYNGDGTTANPAYSFQSTTGMGFFRSTTLLGVAVSGTAQVYFANGAFYYDRANGYFLWSSTNKVGFCSGTASGGATDAMINRVATGTIGTLNAAETAHCALRFRRTYSDKTTDYTVLITDGESTLVSDDDNRIFTLPTAASALSGFRVTFINTAAAGAALMSISPAAADAIVGTIGAVTASGVANKDWRNTKATQVKGDYCVLESDGVNTWYIVGGVGVWASEP